MDRKKVLDGARSSIPICLGLIPIGISYGLLAVEAGLTKFQTVLMSATVMAGSSQILAVGMIGQAGVITIVIAVFLINLRHMVMSCSVMNDIKKTPLVRKLFYAFTLSDESSALFLLSAKKSEAFLLGANVTIYLTWVLGSFLGCMLGDFLPELVAKSFGVAFYASFVAMLMPHVKKSLGIALLVLLAAVMNTLLQLVLPVSWAMIISMIASAAIGTFFVKEDEDAAE